MSVLVLMLTARPDAGATPWALVENGAVLARGAVAPGEAPDLADGLETSHAPSRSPSHAVALMPSESVFLRRLPVPGGSQRDARRAAPFLIEEHLGQTLESVSVEIGPRGADGARYVMAIDRSLRDSWRRVAAGLGVKPVLAAPDAMVIEGHGADLCVFEMDGRVLVQTPSGDLNAPAQNDGERDLDAAAADPVIAGFETSLSAAVLPALAARIRPRRVLVSQGFDPGLTAPDDAPIALKRQDAPDLAVCAAHLPVDAFAVLPATLGGGLASGFDWAQTLAPWRAAAALALAALIATIGLNAGQTALLERRAQAYETARAEVFETAFPETRAVNMQVQLRRRLASVGAVDSGGGFLQLASALSSILENVDGVRVDSLRYDAERGGLAVSALYADFGDFEALRAAAETQDVIIEDGGARQSGDGVSGDFTVRLP